MSFRYFAGSTPKSSCVASNHVSMPPCSTFAAASSSSAGVSGCSSSVTRSTKNGSGTPHCRWRDSVQSGRLAIIPYSRALPQAGKNSVASMPASAVARSVCFGFDAVVAGNVVHAGEPLRRRAIDDRRLVPPAVHVAVRVLFGVEQRARLAQRLDDLRIRIPDLHAAEERQVGREHAVALHRIQDVVVLHAVAAARLEVVDAVRRRRMDDAGALLERHELAEIDGRRAIVERMPEREVLERRALRRRDDVAFALVALEAGVDQILGEDRGRRRRFVTSA